MQAVKLLRVPLDCVSEQCVGVQCGQGGLYGTRSQTVMAVWRDGRVELRERFRGAEDEWSEVQHAFNIEAMSSKVDTCHTQQA